MLYPNLIELLKISKEHGIKNKLITNGSILAHNNEIRKVCDYLNSLTLSIDSIDSNTNDFLGRGKDHYDDIKNILDYVQDKDIKLNINTVVTQRNKEEIEELGEFLNHYKINMWKFFKFMPLRETAKENKNFFEISNQEFENFENKSKVFGKFENISSIDCRQEEDMEEKYTLIIANGDIVKTENGKDVIKGNALYDNVVQFMNEKKDKKIKVIVAHDDENVIKEILESMKKVSFAEVVGTSKNGEEALEEIRKLKPDMAFVKYDFKHLDGFDIIKKSKEELHEDMPVFNLFVGNDTISQDKLKDTFKEVGSKLNSLIGEEYNSQVVDIINDFKSNK